MHGCYILIWSHVANRHSNFDNGMNRIIRCIHQHVSGNQLTRKEAICQYPYDPWDWCIYHTFTTKSTIHVGIYTIHGSYGICQYVPLHLDSSMFFSGTEQQQVPDNHYLGPGNWQFTNKKIPAFFHQKFQVPKMEVLNLIRLFWGWGFPYITLTYSLYR